MVAHALVGVGCVEGEPEGGHVGGRQAEVALIRVQKLLPLVASERARVGRGGGGTACSGDLRACATPSTRRGAASSAARRGARPVVDACAV
jgi:hypothetical protein